MNRVYVFRYVSHLLLLHSMSWLIWRLFVPRRNSVKEAGSGGDAEDTEELDEWEAVEKAVVRRDSENMEEPDEKGSWRSCWQEQSFPIWSFELDTS